MMLAVTNIKTENQANFTEAWGPGIPKKKKTPNPSCVY
jgi:hypothetical protein